MSTQKLSNISLALFRYFLQKAGCECQRSRGGHEYWHRPGLTRPITLQTHIDPVPEFIVKNALRALDISREQFFSLINN
ncbi:type II toxin-antitoxin system HicA family toxin [Larkinella sp. VNQ87]|uniref:type II toxin-antitoxin system HicA family toxin n=1 Tax=Larkinella sp. VNQ87 TaxID=3400921 RepID=UPI003C0F28E3